MELNEILSPIEGENPSGANLYYSPIFAEIKEARREDVDASQGEWEHEVKTANFAAVLRLTKDALATKSKDLQLAAWLGEALIYEQSAQGLCDGIQLIQNLLETFWDTLYPELEDGDAEFRAAPIEWFGNYFDPGKGSSPALAVRRLPLTRSKINFLQYNQSRGVPSEEEGKLSEAKAETRQAAIEEGKLTPEAFDSAFRETPKAFYKGLDEQLKSAAESLTSLEKVCDEKFADYAPGFRELKQAIADVSNLAGRLLREKLKLEPDIVETPVSDAVPSAESDGSAATLQEPGLEPLESLGAAPLQSRQDAVRHLISVAQYLRRTSAADPVGYLIIRALRWGELRRDYEAAMRGGQLLDAPSAETRMALKRAALAGEWSHVLELAESAAAQGCGRAWLDLHRYTIRASEELGYSVVARALRSELKVLLADLPNLASMTLADDTGTANPETLRWLIQEGLFEPTQVEQVNAE